MRDFEQHKQQSTQDFLKCGVHLLPVTARTENVWTCLLHIFNSSPEHFYHGCKHSDLGTVCSQYRLLKYVPEQQENGLSEM